jgi:hypothetical protein
MGDIESDADSDDVKSSGHGVLKDDYGVESSGHGCPRDTHDAIN